MSDKFYIYKWVYRITNVLYVGKTTNLQTRTNHHKNDKIWLSKDVELYYAELPNKTDMDIYEIYYINKYKPKYNTRFMNNIEFSIELPKLDFKLYEQKNKNENPKSFYNEPVILNNNETGKYLKNLYMEVNNLDVFKVKNSYLYEVIKNYHYDFIKLIYDLCAGFEEKDNKILLNKRKTLYFNSPRVDFYMLSLFKRLNIFDIQGNYYIFDKDIISYKFFERIKEKAIKILENNEYCLVKL